MAGGHRVLVKGHDALASRVREQGRDTVPGQATDDDVEHDRGHECRRRQRVPVAGEPARNEAADRREGEERDSKGSDANRERSRMAVSNSEIA